MITLTIRRDGFDSDVYKVYGEWGAERNPWLFATTNEDGIKGMFGQNVLEEFVEKDEVTVQNNSYWIKEN